MSWGERSCKHKPCPIPKECSMETCNVDCRRYEWDGVTERDSSPQIKYIEEPAYDSRIICLNNGPNRKERRKMKALKRRL